MLLSRIIFFIIVFIFVENSEATHSSTKSSAAAEQKKSSIQSIRRITISLFPSGNPAEDSGESLSRYPSINYGNSSQSVKIKRGEYLVKLGDCIACHTKKGGKPFAGGIGFDTPFGIIFSPNITPDKKTGIGNWSYAQLDKALRQGIAPKHRYLYPAFPYIYFNLIKDQDVIDIKAYLDAIPAVENKIPANRMLWPFNWRFLQLGWRTLFFYAQKTGSYKYNSQHNASWNRGAYLVQGLGHCDMCHTPMYKFISKNLILGAPKRKYHLNGSYVSGFYAPNISELYMKNVTFDNFKKLFLNYQLIEGGDVQGPMRQAIHDSLRYLTVEDIHAIYDYLQTVKNKVAKKPKINLNLTGGKKIYKQYCSLCHENTKGLIEGAPSIHDFAAWHSLKKLGLDSLYDYAVNGVDGMPIKGTCMDCTPDEIKVTVQYMLQQSQNSQPKPVPKPSDRVSLVQGKEIYRQYCAGCHQGAMKEAPKDKGLDTLVLSVWKGVGKMPPRGSCEPCTMKDIKAAVVYMLNESDKTRDFQLW